MKVQIIDLGVAEIAFIINDKHVEYTIINQLDSIRGVGLIYTDDKITITSEEVPELCLTEKELIIFLRGMDRKSDKEHYKFYDSTPRLKGLIKYLRKNQKQIREEILRAVLC